MLEAVDAILEKAGRAALLLLAKDPSNDGQQPGKRTKLVY